MSVFLGLAGFTFQEPVHLNGLEAYGRFGNAIASLGDLDQDGYNGESCLCVWNICSRDRGRKKHC